MLRRFFRWLIGQDNFNVEVHVHVHELTVKVDSVKGPSKEESRATEERHFQSSDEVVLQRAAERFTTKGLGAATPEVKFGKETS